MFPVCFRTVEKYQGGVIEVFRGIGMFLGVFIGSFTIGLAVGCLNALMTKFTHIREYPLLESTLLILMSYCTYLCAEAAHMSGKCDCLSVR